MFQQMKKRIKNEKGLTLIELLAVIVILAIVAAIAIPAIGNIIENSRYNAAKADAVNVLNAANIYFTDEGTPVGGTVTVTKLSDGGYLETAGKVPAATTITKASGGNTISASVPFSGEKNLVLTNATITGINGDKQKGSGTLTAITK